MEKIKNDKRQGWRDFIKLVGQTNPSKLIIVIALILSIGTTIVGLFVPLFTKSLVNDFSVSALSTDKLIMMVAAIFVQAIASGIAIYLLNHVGQSVIAEIRERLWNKLLKLPVSYYDEHQTGEIVSRMTNDTGVVKDLITNHLASFFSGIISIVGSIVVMVILDWKMTLVMFTAIPLSVVMIFPLGRKMHQIAKAMQDETAHFTASLSQVLAEIRLVKASNAEEIELKNGNRGIRNLFQFGLKETKIQAFITPLVSLIVMVLLVVILGFGGMRVASGALSAGDLIAFIMYLFPIVMPLAQLTAFFTQFQKALGATERIVQILDEEEEYEPANLSVNHIHLPLQIEKLSFSYKHSESVLHELSLTVEPGKVTAIVGPSGSGKTTLFSLLERFYQPNSGKIILGDQPINEFSLPSWRSQFGYVSQESSLLAGTIRDNLCYGIEREVTDAELQQVAKMAYADQFIQDLPNGFDTEVGERGVKLSGGQRQRIAIARALLRNPKILMLDEATSSLDSKSEIVVQKALENLMAGRTTLVIAHRLSTVVKADRIFFLDKGRLTGSGTHHELVKTHPLYREFATQQLQLNEQIG